MGHYQKPPTPDVLARNALTEKHFNPPESDTTTQYPTSGSLRLT